MFPLGLQASPPPNLQRDDSQNFKVFGLVRFLPSKQTEAFMDLINGLSALCKIYSLRKAHHAHDIAVKNRHRYTLKHKHIISRGSAGEMKDACVAGFISAPERWGGFVSVKGIHCSFLKPFITLWIFSFNGLFFAPNYPTLSTEDHGQTDQASQTLPSSSHTCVSFPQALSLFSLSVSKQCVVMITDVVCRQWAICVCRGRWVSRLRFGYISFRDNC